MSDLNVERITKQYPTRDEPLEVLRDVSFRLSGGESLAILGPSGSGKSTLLHVLGTLESPTSGKLELNDTDVLSMDDIARARFRNRSIGFVFQDHHLLPQLSVLENVLIPALANSKTGTTSKHADRAKELVKMVGLTSRSDHRPAELSGGERQRVAVARALLMKPNLVLADEPTGNLDSKNATGITDLLLELLSQSNDASTMLVVVTHSEQVAGRLARRAFLRDGVLEESS